MNPTLTPVEQFKAMATGAKSRRKTKEDYAAKFAATPTAPAQSDAERQEQRALFERHDLIAVSLRIPLAPTVNNYRNIFTPPGGRPMFRTSAAGRAYHEAVAKVWVAHHRGWTPDPLTGRLRVRIVCHMARNGTADLDGRLKALLDAMTNAKVWDDDGQIDDLHIVRGSVCPPGFLDVTVEVISE